MHQAMILSVFMIIIFLLPRIRCSTPNPFPLQQLYPNMKISEEIEKDMLCTNGGNIPPRCDCTPDCARHQTCCIDYLWSNVTTKGTKPESLSVYLARFLEEARKYRQLRCTPIVSGVDDGDGGHSSDMLLMVARCPKGVGGKVRGRCKDKSFNVNTLPVVGEDGIVYKNKYCAVCNGIADYKAIQVEAGCIDKVTSSRRVRPARNLLDDFYGCQFTTNQTDPYIKPCNSMVVAKCPKITRQKATLIGASTDNGRNCRLCKAYNAGVYTMDNKCCKNPHCCRDSFRDTSNLSAPPSTCPLAFPASARLVPNSVTLPRYSLLLSYETEDELRERSETENSDFICAKGYVRQHSGCVVEAPKNVEYKPSTENSRCLPDEVYIVVRNARQVRRRALRRLRGLPPSSGHYDVTFQNRTHLILHVSHLSHVNVSRILSVGNFKFETVKTSVPVRHLTAIYGMDFFRYFPGSRVCSTPIIRKLDDFHLSDDCFLRLNGSVISSKDYILITKTTHKPNHNTNRDMNHDVDRNSAAQKYIVTCAPNHFHLNHPCKFRSAKLLNYTKIPQTTHIRSATSNRTYMAHQYQPLRNSLVRVCIPPPKVPNMWKNIVEAVEGYITVIGSCCSIIGYIWVIVTYTMVKELRTIPGKNIVCLCTALCCCDVVELCSMVAQFCHYAAILLHYFALAAQFWGTVTAFDIWSTFQGTTFSRNQRSAKRFLCYCIAGWFAPLLCVALTMVLDVVRVADVGYGKYGVCWIVDLPVRIATYIIPTGVLTLSSICFLVYTLYRIRRQCNKSKTLLKKRGGEEINFTRMTLKLVLLLGAIEIVGFLQFRDNTTVSWVFTSVFQLLYTIVRSFRGVFVALLYIVTDRVFKIYKDLRESSRFKESTTKLMSMSMSGGRSRTYSTRSSENFNTTLTITPSPTPL